MAPAEEVLAPPPVARALPVGPGRIYTDESFHKGAVEILLLDPETAGPSQLRAVLDRLDPYTGTLWGLSYALHGDFDLMLTGWARYGLDVFRETLATHGMGGAETLRLMGAWGVGNLLIRRPFEEVSEEWRLGDARPERVHLLSNGERRPLLRTLRSVAFYPTPRAAFEAATVNRFEPATQGWWLGEGPGGHPAEPAALLDADIAATRILVEYEAPTGGYLEVATTWDAGWSATAGGAITTVHPTALGQMGLVLPPGRGRIELTYAEPRLALGASLTLVGLLAAILLVRRERRAVA